MSCSRPVLVAHDDDVVTPDGITRVDIAIGDGTILEISSVIGDSAPEEIDARGLHVLPGAINVHVHFNEPGRADWEGWTTSSAACAVGGISVVADMPLNAQPSTPDGPSFDGKRAAAELGSHIDYALCAGVSGCQSLLTSPLSEGHDTRGLPLALFFELLASAPARRVRLPNKDQIAPGCDADLDLVDIDRRFTLEAGGLRHRHRHSPFAGMTFTGLPWRTNFHGETVAIDGDVVGRPRGRLLRPTASGTA